MKTELIRHYIYVTQLEDVTKNFHSCASNHHYKFNKFTIYFSLFLTFIIKGITNPLSNHFKDFTKYYTELYKPMLTTITTDLLSIRAKRSLACSWYKLIQVRQVRQFYTMVLQFLNTLKIIEKNDNH